MPYALTQQSRELPLFRLRHRLYEIARIVTRSPVTVKGVSDFLLFFRRADGGGGVRTLENRGLK